MPWRRSPICWTPPTPASVVRDRSWCDANCTPHRTLWKSPTRGFTFTPTYSRRNCYRRYDKMAEEGLLVQSPHRFEINTEPGASPGNFVRLAAGFNSFDVAL